MSMILQENWEFLSREHDYHMQDPAYRKWVEEMKDLPPLTKEEEKIWDAIVQKGQAGPSSLPF